MGGPGGGRLTCGVVYNREQSADRCASAPCRTIDQGAGVPAPDTGDLPSEVLNTLVAQVRRELAPSSGTDGRGLEGLPYLQSSFEPKHPWRIGQSR
jgi:hypothetical protein